MGDGRFTDYSSYAHAPPRPHSSYSATLKVSCAGVTENGVADAEPCRGIARSTGQRCRIKWGLNAMGYCKHHGNSTVARQCVAIACHTTQGIDSNGFCHVHQQSQARQQIQPPCQGTSAFFEPQLVKVYDGQALYHGDPSNLTTPGFQNWNKGQGATRGEWSCGTQSINPPSTSSKVSCAACGVSWGLDMHGFCKHHASDAEPCRGIARSTGERCRITSGLDANGFCQYHVVDAEPCRGIARSTGQRCRIKWGLNAMGYCKYHENSAVGRQCVATAYATGQRCRVTQGIDSNGFCSVHQQSQAHQQDRPRCQGTVFYSGAPCTNDAKMGYAYCCAAHDPAIPYVSPRLFDVADGKTRAFYEPQLVQVYKERDLYHGDLLDLTTPGFVELDHILEKQCFSFAFQQMALADSREDQHDLASFLREEVANDLTNMCLTRAATNKIKGAAVWKFLDDSTTGHLGSRSMNAVATSSSPSFTDYMLAENRDGMRLGRNTTRVIVREMGRALKCCQRKLAQEGETPLLDELSTQLQRVFVMMDLHVAASIRSQFDTKAKPHDSRGDQLAGDTAVAMPVGRGSAPQGSQQRTATPTTTTATPTPPPPPLSTTLLASVVHAKPFVPKQATPTVHPTTPKVHLADQAVTSQPADIDSDTSAGEHEPAKGNAPATETMGGDSAEPLSPCQPEAVDSKTPSCEHGDNATEKTLDSANAEPLPLSSAPPSAATGNQPDTNTAEPSGNTTVVEVDDQVESKQEISTGNSTA